MRPLIFHPNCDNNNDNDTSNFVIASLDFTNKAHYIQEFTLS